MQSVNFSYFDLEDGLDNSGVPTKIVSLNATATLNLYNPSRFFGYHIRGSPITLDYLDLPMATGQVKFLHIPYGVDRKCGFVTATVLERSFWCCV